MIMMSKQLLSRHTARTEIYFEQELREFDFHLGRLFKYIEDNYSDDEIVISLFSDHGAAFMIDNGEPFVSWQRMNVPMMIRGTGGIRGVCDEVVESADYAAMMCALAGIKYDYTGTDANLPKVLGGTREREYALSQSLLSGICTVVHCMAEIFTIILNRQSRYSRNSE